MGTFRSVVICALGVSTCVLNGCALSYVDDRDRVHVIGVANVVSDADRGQKSLAGDYVKLDVYGVWLDTAFSDAFIGLGRSQLSAATLRNVWEGQDTGSEPEAVVADANDCRSRDHRRWFVDCTIQMPNSLNTSGMIVDGTISGLGLGGAKDISGNDVLRVALGYTRSVIVSLNEDVLVCGDPREDLRSWDLGEDKPAENTVLGTCT